MLEINGISKTYRNGVKALNNISLSIPKGIFGLLGPNGSGKSSLMRTIATLQQPDEGSITFNGIDVLKDPHTIRSSLGYLPQDFNVYPRISALNLLNHLAILKGLNDSKIRKEVVEGLLVQTNLFDSRKKMVSTFSGGMRQRFGVAQALIGDPDLLIVDEPTAGLDPEERNRFHNLIADLGENKVVILSTHIVEDVSELCSNMAVIANGQTHLLGKPADLIQALEGKIWYKTISKADLDEHKSSFNVISTRLRSGNTILHVLADQDPGEGFEQISPDLEDVYFSTLFKVKQAMEGKE